MSVMDDLFGSPPPKGRDRAAERAKRLAAAPERICDHCGISFRAIQKDRKSPRFCSKTCSGKATIGAIRDAAPLVAPKRVTYSVYRPLCDCCGMRFTTRQPNARVCSEECRAEHARREARRHAVANDNRDRAPRPCAECGVVFIPEYGNKKRDYCSDKCLKRKSRRVAKGVRKARMRGTRADPVNAIAVFDRDGWTCQLCGIDTPRDKRGTYDDDAPELDHIIPLARGGAHTNDNVQCACRSCNADKGDSLPIAA